MTEHDQLQYPFDKQVEVRFNVELPGGGVADLVYLDGEPVPHQTSLSIDSDMDFRHLEFTVLHMPSVQEIVVSGYVIPWTLLDYNHDKQRREVERFEPEGFGGYFIEESEMQRITEMFNAQRDAEALGYAVNGATPGVPRPNTRLKVGA